MPRKPVDPRVKAAIARDLVAQQLTRKQIAFKYKVSVTTVVNVLQERVVLRRVMVLRFPEEDKLVFDTLPGTSPTPDEK